MLIAALVTVSLFGGALTPLPIASAMSCQQALADANNWKQRVDQHNANKPNQYDAGAVSAYNAEADALNAEKATVMANLHSCQQGPPELRPPTLTDPVTGEQLPGVPPDAPGTLTRNQKGWQYPVRGTPGLADNVDTLRIQGPVNTGRYQYPNGYGVYQDQNGFEVNPHTGAGSLPRTDPYRHIPL